MNIASEMIELFPDVVSVQTIVRSGSGTPTEVGEALVLRARVIGHHMVVRGRDGKERISTVKATFAGTFGLTIDHLYTLPSRFVPNNPAPIKVDTFSDETGPHHEVVYFQAGVANRG